MFTNGSAMYARSGGINVNLYWGLVLLIFGSIMFTLGRRNQRRLDKEMARENAREATLGRRSQSNLAPSAAATEALF